MPKGFYPKAIVKNIPPGSNDPSITPVGGVLHVRDGLGESLFPYFNGPSGGIESHFYIRFDGTCVTPETKVLTKDLRWKPIGDLFVGDRLVAFDETRPRRCYREAVVEWIERDTAEVFAVVMDDGSVVHTTADHRWLSRSQGGRLTWRRTVDSAGRPLTGTRIPVLSAVWDEPSSYSAGWMGGFLDGEGSLNRKHLKVSFAQRPTVVFDAAVDYLKREGFTFHNSLTKASSDCRTIGITGGVAEQLRILGTTRPERLISRFSPDSMGMLGSGNHRTVVAVYSVGEREIVKMQTSTRTFIAEGYGMHNCEQYRSIYFEADANLDGNSFFRDGKRVGLVSIETEGLARGKWTKAQLASIKEVILWLNTEAGIPLQVIQRWDGNGWGYHVMWGSPSHWTPVAKSCPGPERVKQFWGDIAIWIKTAGQPPRLNRVQKARKAITDAIQKLKRTDPSRKVVKKQLDILKQVRDDLPQK